LELKPGIEAISPSAVKGSDLDVTSGSFQVRRIAHGTDGADLDSNTTRQDSEPYYGLNNSTVRETPGMSPPPPL